MKGKTIWCFFICVLLFISCDNAPKTNGNNTKKENKNIKHEQFSIKLVMETVPENKMNYILNEKIKVKISQSDTTKFDSIQVYFSKSYIETITELPAEIEVICEKTGNISFETRIFKKGQNIIEKLNLRALSDIVPKQYTYKINNVYPHDRKAFTQGLVFENGFFYEATGMKGESSVRKVQYATGDIIQSYSIDQNIFGEGITIFGDKIIQLSWTSRVGFVYDKNSFQLLTKFNYPTEGWGLTNDGDKLIMSDGTSNIYFLDSESYTEVGRIEVCDNKGFVNSLNELEFIDGEIYANIYQTEKIARIDPLTGKVLAYIDLTSILPSKDYASDTDVLNGIAYDFDKKKLFVTGKRWPKLFEISLSEKKE